MSDELERRVTNRLQALFDARTRDLPRMPGLLGKSNNQGNASVAGREGWVYVRLGSNETLAQAYNDRVPHRNGLPVIVGYAPEQPTLFQVLSIRQVHHDEMSSGQAIAPHHTQHEWPNEDVVYVDTRQMMPCRVSIDTALTVKIFQGVAPLDGAWVSVTEQTLDLTAYKPGAGVCYVLVYLDADGVLSAEAGTARDSDAELDISDCPMSPSTGLALAAVRLSYASTALVEGVTKTDIRDLRFFASSSASLLTDVRAIVLKEIERLEYEIFQVIDNLGVRGV